MTRIPEMEMEIALVTREKRIRRDHFICIRIAHSARLLLPRPDYARQLSLILDSRRNLDAKGHVTRMHYGEWNQQR